MTRLTALALSGALAALSGCKGAGLNGATGDACEANADCASMLCLPFTDGYCSFDCTSQSCAPGDVCRAISGVSACLKACTSMGDCRTGYQCENGACTPACVVDGDCPRGFGCANGACAPLPGKKIGELCTTDAECSSRLCDPNTTECQLACVNEQSCPNGQTCFVNPVDTNGNGSTDSLAPICVSRRGGGAGSSQCNVDADCDQGQCELGTCVSLCQVSGDCLAASSECVSMFAQTDDALPPTNFCLPRTGTLTYRMPKNYSGPIGMPATVRGLNLFVEAPGESVSDNAGIVGLVDPMQNAIYTPPQTNMEFLALPVRYIPAEGASMMLVPNAPALASIMPGVYNFNAAAGNALNQAVDYTVTARIKLADAAPGSGSIPLHVFVTDLAGGMCSAFDAANAPSKLAPFESMLQGIYQSVGLSVGPIVYADSTAPNELMVPDQGPMPTLDALLKAATAGDANDALEVTIVRYIGSSNGGAFEVLGISGGVPAATGLPGTVHSGVAISLNALCEGGQNAFAITAAHELGHSMGLFHNVEQSGATDSITDDDTDGTNNLMYWLEQSPTQTHLSPQQGQVLLGNPAVH